MPSLSEPTRREALGRILLTITGASVGMLGASGLLVFLSQNHQPQSGTNKSRDCRTSGQPFSPAQLFINIQVYYVGMTNLTGKSMENYPNFRSSHPFRTWSRRSAKNTPHSKQCLRRRYLLNGTAPQGNPSLKDGDIVAFPYNNGWRVAWEFEDIFAQKHTNQNICCLLWLEILG